MRAVILAGGMGLGMGEQEKAFLPIDDRPMFDYVLQALAGVSEIDEKIVVGPKRMGNWIRENYPRQQVRVVEAGENLLQNVRLGIEEAKQQDDRMVLLTTCDIPFLTEEAVDDFLRRCEKDENFDFYYPIIRKEDAEQFFPGMKRTYVKLREGVFTGGNLFLIRPSMIGQMAERADKILQYRKNPLKISAEIGWSFTLRLLFSQVYGLIRIHQLEKRIHQLFGIKARAIISPYPHIGTDIDKPSDLLFAKQIMRRSLALNTKEMI